ncbi:MAG TPA: ABC transporter permease [Gammaproteobacteria bacterium]
MKIIGFVDSVGRDLRHALRQLLRAPLFTVVALVTLGLGVGATTAGFSVVNSVLLNPLPYPDADRLVSIWHAAPGAEGIAGGDLRTSASMYFTYADENRAFESLGIWSQVSATVIGLAEPEQVPAATVSDGVLQTLAVPPALGRWLTAADQQPGGAQNLLISHAYWQRRFGGSSDVLGRTITINTGPGEIVGVMPEGFRIGETRPDIILPFRFDRSTLRLPTFDFRAIARLKPGVTIADANADIERMLPIWMASWPPFPGGTAEFYAEVWRVGPAVRAFKDDVVGNVGNVLWVVMGTVAIVLLVACANVTNLLLVRAEGRRHELAVRAALGAGAWRVGRVPLLESLLLGAVGGLLGVGLAYAALQALVAMAPSGLPRIDDISLDARALAFSLGVSVFAGLVPGLISVAKNLGSRVSTGLHDGARGAGQRRESHRTQNALVIAEVALALVLLVNAGLMIRTFQALLGVEPGFTEPQQLQTMRIAIPAPLVAEPERVTRLQNDIVDALAALPGVESAAFTSSMPMEGFATAWNGVQIDGQPPGGGVNGPPWPVRRFTFVSPGLLETAGVRLVAGRDLTWTDLYELRRSVLISENFAREVWGTPQAALGWRIGDSAAWNEIVGVVQDVREDGVTEPAPTLVYWPAMRPNPNPGQQQPFVQRTATFVVRSPRAGTESFLREVQQAVWSVNANLPVSSLRTMQEVYDTSLSRLSFTLTMLAAASGIALILGIVGLYGVLACAVGRHRREIAIRLALGAQQRAVTRTFVRHGVALAALGVVIGLAAAAGVTRLMTSLLYEVAAVDPVTYAAVAVGLIGIALLASYVPARRAAAIDPIETLKRE